MQNETIKKFSAEAASRIAKIFESEDLKAFIAKTKEATDSGTFEVVISTADVDRSGEVVDQAGWDLKNYMQNPIVLWGHDYYSLPIGVTDELKIEDGKLIARGRFAPEEANPFAQQVRRLYDAKIVRATSVGFIVRDMQGKTITQSELLEFSFVPVPANPYALSMRDVTELGLDTDMLSIKGLTLEVKEEKEETAKAEGDTCTLEDGTEGEMKPNGEGTLVCMPKVTENSEQPQAIKENVAVGERAEGDEGEEHRDGGAPNQRSKSAGDDGSENLKDFLAARQLLREVATVVTDSLEKMNRIAREKSR